MTIIESVEKFLCKHGIHKMKNHKKDFYDYIGGTQIYISSCYCGNDIWLVDTLFPFSIFKVKRKIKEENK